MACAETWDLDELFAEVRCSYPYRNLGRRQFDAVVQMLADVSPAREYGS